MVARTSIATGVGETTVKKISKEYREEGQFESPMKRYTMERVRLYPDDFIERHYDILSINSTWTKLPNFGQSSKESKERRYL